MIRAEIEYARKVIAEMRRYVEDDCGDHNWRACSILESAADGYEKALNELEAAYVDRDN